MGMLMVLIKNDEKIEVSTTKNGRFYYKFDEKGNRIAYPSVTTVIHFADGRKKSSGSPAAAIGSLVHYHILKKYTNKKLDFPTDPVWRMSAQDVHGRINRALAMWQQLGLKIEPIEVETALVNEKLRYAGRLDLLGYVNGIFTLLDLKTGVPYNDHVIQGGAYYNALDDKPDQVMYVYLDSIVERNPKQEGSIRIFNKEELTEGYEEFKRRYVDFIMPNVDD